MSCLLFCSKRFSIGLGKHTLHIILNNPAPRAYIIRDEGCGGVGSLETSR